MAIFVPRWLRGKNPATPTDGTDKTDKPVSVGSVGAGIVRPKEIHVPAEPTPADAILAAARLLRENRWATEPPVCDFHTGKAGEYCHRCGASWIEHYPAPVDGASP